MISINQLPLTLLVLVGPGDGEAAPAADSADLSASSGSQPADLEVIHSGMICHNEALLDRETSREEAETKNASKGFRKWLATMDYEESKSRVRLIRDWPKVMAGQKQLAEEQGIRIRSCNEREVAAFARCFGAQRVLEQITDPQIWKWNDHRCSTKRINGLFRLMDDRPELRFYALLESVRRNPPSSPRDFRNTWSEDDTLELVRLGLLPSQQREQVELERKREKQDQEWRLKQYEREHR